MQLSHHIVQSRRLHEVQADVVLVPLAAGEGGSSPRPICPVPDVEDVSRIASVLGLRDVGASAVVPRSALAGEWSASLVLLVNLASEANDAAQVAVDVPRSINRAFAAAKNAGFTTIAIPGNVALAGALGVEIDLPRMLVDAVLDAAYEFDGYRSRDRVSDREIRFVDLDPSILERAQAVAHAVTITKDLVNTPPGDMLPMDVADVAVAECERAGIPVKVLEKDALVAGGFGGIAAVGRGAAGPPCLVVLGDHESGAAADATALVGKGITFDTGGLNVKPDLSMLTMKCDMAGAATVLGTMVAAASLGLQPALRGYLACAENGVDGRAYHPSDILRHHNGLTVEIVSTDAEGRLVLGDGLSYAAEASPSRMIDIATLTGSTALGQALWGVMGTDQGLIDELLVAGRSAGEPGWQLPLWDGYVSSLKSDVADLKNFDSGAKWGYQGILGGLYLREFVGDIPWAHLDMAAPAFFDSGDDSLGQRAGATANPMRAILEWVANRDAAEEGRDDASAAA